MTFTAVDIGPLYDVGIATRDGSSLPVKRKDGKVINVSQVAFMVSGASGTTVEEATDLTRKDQLVRLSSGNLMDREFTNFPQSEQGSWVGGEGQKVSTDVTKYWTGNGLLWPLSALSPSASYLQQPVQDGATSGNPSPAPGVVAGTVATKTGFGFCYRNAGNNVQLIFQSTQDGSRLADTTALLSTIVDFTIIADRFFWIGQVGNFAYTLYISDGTTSTKLVDGPAAVTLKNPIGIYSGLVGANSVLAVVYSGDDARVKVDLYNVTTAPAYNVAASTTVLLPVGVSVTVQDLTFQGDQAIISVRIGHENIILSSTMAAVVTTLTRLSGYSAVYLCSVEGVLVLLAVGGNPASGVDVDEIDIYTLIGNNVLFVTSAPLAYNQLPSLVSRLTRYGPYALFTASYQMVNGAIPASIPLTTQSGGIEGFVYLFDGTNVLVLYAFDATRNTLFTVDRSIGPSIGVPKQVAAVSAQRLVAGGGLPNVVFAWVAVVWTGEGSYQYAAFGPAIRSTAPGTKTASSIHTSGSILSSLLDFTQGTVKLFRRLVVNHDPIPAPDPNAYVRARVWFDAFPDTIGATVPLGGDITNRVPGSKQTILPLNKTAKKIVYEVDYVSSVVAIGTPAISALGGAVPGTIYAMPGLAVPATIATTSGQPPTLNSLPAPRPIDVDIQVATGWITKAQLAMSDEARTNNQGTQEYCFKNQDSQLDAMAAYNFLRSIWRLQGSECFVTLANGDAYNAYLESESFKSPKPFGVSMVSDRPDTYSTLLDVTIREDL